MKFLDKKRGKTTKKPVASKPKPDSLLFHLHDQMCTTQPARPHKRVHASEMNKQILTDYRGMVTHEFCPREYALMDLLNKERPDEVITTANQKVFDEGNATANILIHRFADAGLAVGDWECRHCGHKYRFRRRPKKCVVNNCGHLYFKYHEIRFRSKTSGISCGIDMFFLTSKETLQVTEYKTLKDDEFKKLEAPLAEHKARTSLYLRIIADSGFTGDPIPIDLLEARVLYTCKGGWGWQDPEIDKYGKKNESFSPFKEFIIKRNDKLSETKWQHAIRLKEFRDQKKGIPLGLCPTQFCPRASSCSVREECFSGRFKGVP